VQGGARTVREWASIEAIDDTPDGIEFNAPGSGALMVRNRAFGSDAERAQFLALARDYHHRAPRGRPKP